MDDNTRLVLVLLIGMFASQVLPMVQAWLNSRASQARGVVQVEKIEEATKVVQQLEVNTNSKMDKVMAMKDELLEAAVQAASAKGELKGAADEQARTSPAQK